MLRPRTLEVGARFAWIAGDDSVDHAALSEARAVVGYFWRAHDLKLQIDAGQLRFGERFGALSPRARAGLPGLGTRLVSGEPLADTQVRAQLQLAF